MNRAPPLSDALGTTFVSSSSSLSSSRGNSLQATANSTHKTVLGGEESVIESDGMKLVEAELARFKQQAIDKAAAANAAELNRSRDSVFSSAHREVDGQMDLRFNTPTRSTNWDKPPPPSVRGRGPGASPNDTSISRPPHVPANFVFYGGQWNPPPPPGPPPPPAPPPPPGPPPPEVLKGKSMQPATTAKPLSTSSPETTGGSGKNRRGYDGDAPTTLGAAAKSLILIRSMTQGTLRELQCIGRDTDLALEESRKLMPAAPPKPQHEITLGPAGVPVAQPQAVPLVVGPPQRPPHVIQLITAGVCNTAIAALAVELVRTAWSISMPGNKFLFTVVAFPVGGYVLSADLPHGRQRLQAAFNRSSAAALLVGSVAMYRNSKVKIPGKIAAAVMMSGIYGVQAVCSYGRRCFSKIFCCSPR